MTGAAGLPVAQLWDQLRWIEVGEGVEDIPALLSGGLDDGAEGGEAFCAVGGAKAAGDFLTQLDHPAASCVRPRPAPRRSVPYSYGSARLGPYVPEPPSARRAFP